MTIEILCGESDHCEVVRGRVCQALSDLNLNADVVSIYDPSRLAQSNIAGQAGVVIDGQLVDCGDRATAQQFKRLIDERLNKRASG